MRSLGVAIMPPLYLRVGWNPRRLLLSLERNPGGNRSFSMAAARTANDGPTRLQSYRKRTPMLVKRHMPGVA
jgi:hypothetical protein